MTKLEYDKYYVHYENIIYPVDIPEHLIKKLYEKIKDDNEFEWVKFELEEMIDEENLE